MKINQAFMKPTDLWDGLGEGHISTFNIWAITIEEKLKLRKLIRLRGELRRDKNLKWEIGYTLYVEIVTGVSGVEQERGDVDGGR